MTQDEVQKEESFEMTQDEVQLIDRDGQWDKRHVTWHGHGLVSVQHEHVSVEHVAWHSTHVGWAGLRILGTWTLKARHN